MLSDLAIPSTAGKCAKAKLLILAALAAAAILALAGCGGTQPSATTPTTKAAAGTIPTTKAVSAPPTPSLPTWKAEPAGKFTLAANGAVITFTMPSSLTDPAVAPIEAYRVKTGGAPVTYIVADVDNRNGSVLVNMYRIMAFDKEGHEYLFSTVTDAIGSWEPIYGSDYKYKMPNGTPLDDTTGTALYAEGVNLQNANISDADVGARKTVVLAAQASSLPAEFTRVAVLPSGAGTEIEATPAP